MTGDFCFKISGHLHRGDNWNLMGVLKQNSAAVKLVRTGRRPLCHVAFCLARNCPGRFIWVLRCSTGHYFPLEPGRNSFAQWVSEMYFLEFLEYSCLRKQGVAVSFDHMTMIWTHILVMEVAHAFYTISNSMESVTCSEKASSAGVSQSPSRDTVNVDKHDCL